MREKKKIIILGVIFLILLFFGLGYYFLRPRFYIKRFTKERKITYQTSFFNEPGSICYGNIFRCEVPFIKEEGDVDTTKLGSYQITYIYTYKDKDLVLNQDIEVVDNVIPIIIPSDPIFYCPNGTLYPNSYTATDNYDGDITSQVVSSIKENKVSLSVKDKHGNSSITNVDGTLKDDDHLF